MTRIATGGDRKHTTTRRTSPYASLRGRFARRIEIIGVLAGLLAGLCAALAWAVASGLSHQVRPALAIAHPPQVVHVRADAESNPAVLDEEWAAYSDRSTCADWAGGDGVSAIAVSRSQLAWFFADTFLGPAGPSTGYSHLSGFVNNSVVVQTTTGTDSTFVTMTGGGGCGGARKGQAARSVVGPPLAPGAPGDRYWDADGIEVGGTIVKFYNRYLPGRVPFIPTGTVMATFPVSQLTSADQPSGYGAPVARPGVIPVPSYVPPAGGTPVIWGAALLRAGGMIYVYGRQSADPSAPDAQLYLARVPAPDLTRFTSWRFYAGGGQWAAGQQNAQPVQPGTGLSVSSGFSVVSIAGRYWLIQAGPQLGGADIVAYPAAAPWGPFDAAAGLTLYHNNDVGLDPAHDYRMMYEARAELALSSSHTLVISYNVNSSAVTTGCIGLSSYTNTVVQPKFIAVPTAVFAPGAVPDRFTLTIGPPDYPQIVSRDPSQWFNGWTYPDGCPPVPGLTGVQAKTAAGTVTLNWPDDGLNVRYHVYLSGPGENGRVAATYRLHATVTGLRPGEYSATVIPVNNRDTAGGSATVQFTVP